jgi:hemolysin activation/secretion protein
LKLKIVEGFVEKITYLERPSTGQEAKASAASNGSTVPTTPTKPVSPASEKLKKPGVPGPQSKIDMAFPVTPGETLYLRSIEQGLDQINRVPSNKATLDIKPGEKPGGSELVVTNELKDPWRVNAKYVYTANRSPFEKRGDISLESDDLLKLNDAWYLAYSGTSLSNSLSFQSSLPYGYWLFTASGSYSDAVSQLTSTSDMYTRTGSAALTISRLLMRDATQKVRIEGSYAMKWNDRYINATQLTPQQFPVTRIGVSYDKYLNSAFGAASAGLSHGLGPVHGKDSSVVNAPQAEFVKVDAAVSYNRSYKPGITSYSVLGAQWAPDVMYASEQIVIGGPGSVRGFVSAPQQGDWGAYSQNTLNFPPSAILGSATALDAVLGNELAKYALPLTPYLFFDAGFVRDSANSIDRYAVGAGAGLSYTKDRLTTDVFIGFPISYNSELRSAGTEIRLSVNAKLY